MIYFLIRFVITLVLFGIILYFVRKKSKFKAKRNTIISIIMAVVFLNAFLCIPFENLVISFSTSEEAFNYSYMNQKTIKEVQVSDCSFVMYGADASSVSYCTLNKQEEGWKITSPYTPNFSPANVKMYDKYFISRYSNSQSSKQLIIISSYNLKNPNIALKISDSQNSNFQSFYSKYNNVDYYAVFYYTIVDSNISQYQININDSNIRII